MSEQQDRRDAGITRRQARVDSATGARPLGRRALLLGGLGLGLAPVLAACGGTASTPASGGATKSGETKPAATAAAAGSTAPSQGTTAKPASGGQTASGSQVAEIPDPRAKPVKVPRLAYGMNVWLYNHAENDKVLTLVREAGFGWVRQWVPWSDHEPEQGQMRFGELDPIVDAALRNRVKIMLVVVRAPTWATGTGQYGMPAKPEDFAKFMKAMAARYKGKVSAYEIWNEQNLSHETGKNVDPKEYFELIKAVFPVVKQADPRAAVVFGGLTPTGVNDPSKAVDDVKYLEQIYAINSGEIRQYFDVLGAHTGSNNNPPDTLWPDNPGPGPEWQDHPSFYFRRIEQLREVMEKAGDGNKQVWLTEFGWTTKNAAPGYEYGQYNSEEDQAKYLVQAYEMASERYPWMGVMAMWNLNYSTIVKPEDEKFPWSIINPDYSPRPAYTALKAMPKK